MPNPLQLAVSIEASDKVANDDAGGDVDNDVIKPASGR